MRLFELEEQTTVGAPGTTVAPNTASPTNMGQPAAGQPLSNPQQRRDQERSLMDAVTKAQEGVRTAQENLRAAQKALTDYKSNPANRVP